MARTPAENTTYFDEAQAAAFLALRRAMLGLRDSVVATGIGMDKGSFSQAAAGKDKKGFSSERFARLKTYLDDRIAELKAEASTDPNLVARVKGAEEAYSVIFGSDENRESPEALRYFEPGSSLPLKTRNYVTRVWDDAIIRTLRSTSQSVAVYGGPGSGKSSYLIRLAEAARSAGQRCRYIDFKLHLPSNPSMMIAGQGDGKLTAGELANIVLQALTDDPRTPLKEKEIKNADAKYVGILLHGLLMETFARPEIRDSVIILDGYNEAIYHAEDEETLGVVTTALFGHRLGSGRSKVVLPDDGVSFATGVVSEYVTRAELIETAAVGYYDIDRLAKSVFNEDDISVDPVSSDQLLQAFGGFMFLHHAAFELVRRRAEAAEKAVNSRSLQDALPDAVETILEKIVSANTENEPDRVYRRLARFGRRVEFLLSRIATTHVRFDPASDKAHILRTLEQPGSKLADVSSNYLVQRSMHWTGFSNDVGVMPRFVKAVAGAAAPAVPKRGSRTVPAS